MSVISVIVPVYNGEKTIKETINSALGQAFSDIEIIIINDGSDDSTLDILSSIQDPRLKVFSYTNAGASASRNRGFDHAVGEFIAFLDADDLWTPDKLEAQLKVLQENPQAAVAYSWTDRINESGKFIRKGSYITATGNVFAQLLLTDFLDNGSNPLIRRHAFAEVGGFDESLPAGQDWDLYLRLAARYQFVAVPLPQVLYRVSTNSISSNVLRLELACLQVIERAFSQASQSLQYLKRYSLANLYKYLLFKSFEGPVEQQKKLPAARFLWYAIKNDPGLLKTRVVWKVLFRIILVTLLSPQRSQVLLVAAKQFFSINALLVHTQTDPSTIN